MYLVDVEKTVNGPAYKEVSLTTSRVPGEPALPHQDLRPHAQVVGRMILHYADGAEHRCSAVAGRDVVNWTFPAELEGNRQRDPHMVLAWRGENGRGERLGDATSAATRIAPRWEAAATRKVEAVVRYAASDAHAAYRYRYDRNKSSILLTLTGSGEVFDAKILLPPGVRPRAVTLDGNETVFALVQVEESTYVTARVPAGVHEFAVAPA